jgi:6-phosphogluconate dehydrogenase
VTISIISTTAPSSDSDKLPFKRIGIVGAGSMGKMMTLGFAEQGLRVSLLDIEPENVRAALEKAQQIGPINEKIEGFFDIKTFAKTFGDQSHKVLISL